MLTVILSRDTLERVAAVICALIKKQPIHQKKLANGLSGTSSPVAKCGRLARCFQDEQLDAGVWPFLISLLPLGKQLLTMGRTNWAYGDTKLNRTLGVLASRASINKGGVAQMEGHPGEVPGFPGIGATPYDTELN